MKTPHPLYNDRPTVYTCELTACALCGADDRLPTRAGG